MSAVTKAALFTTVLLIQSLHGMEASPFPSNNIEDPAASSLRAEKREATEFPIWPQDFRWSSNGVPSNFDCIGISEGAGLDTWKDNYFCWRSDKRNPGLRWSSAGPIAGMECTQVQEPAEPSSYTWNDNYLCRPRNSPYGFYWSYTGQIPEKACINWSETADPHGWNDNYLCATYGAGGSTAFIKKDPVFPNDFKWSPAGIPEGYDCIKIVENGPNGIWDDNYFCWKESTKDPQIKWSSAGPVSGLRCTRIMEGAEPPQYTWGDNYLCVPHSSKLRFVWSPAGPVKDHSCIQWNEPADPHGWDDNYLCFEQCRLTKLEVLNPNQYNPTYEGTQIIGAASGAHCMTPDGQENSLSIESEDSVEETTSVELAETSEINWSLSASVEVEASAKILGSGASVTVGLEAGVGGSKSWTRSETKETSKGKSSSVGHESTYLSPGGAVMFGEVRRYKFDQSNVPAKMYFVCPSGGSYTKDSSISMKSTSYQSATFETMAGRFHRKTCQKDPSVVDCIKLLSSRYKGFFGNMAVVRAAFADCFADGKGYIWKRR